MLSQVQRELLEMVKWFDSFCRENGLTYYALGGTLLGAVRHHGFIPWDDDVDVGMPRGDYEQLMKITGEEVFCKYKLETPYSNDPNYCYPYCKLYDTSTTLVENVRCKLKRGLYIDIFPIDGLGDNLNVGMRWYETIHKKNSIFLASICGIREGRAVMKNMAVQVMGLIPECVYSRKKARIELDTMCKKFDIESSAYAGNLLGNWGAREIVEKNLFGKPSEIQFEDTAIMCVAKYDEYLTAIYGDWRQLPPKEKQVSHHDYIKLDLNNSYLEGND